MQILGLFSLDGSDCGLRLRFGEYLSTLVKLSCSSLHRKNISPVTGIR